MRAPGTLSSLLFLALGACGGNEAESSGSIDGNSDTDNGQDGCSRRIGSQRRHAGYVIILGIGAAFTALRRRRSNRALLSMQTTPG
jgi:hypothetical protein